MSTIVDLGRRVKERYPGQYDDLSDVEVGRRVKQKHQEYKDFTELLTADPTPPAKPAGGVLSRAAGYVARDVAGGEQRVGEDEFKWKDIPKEVVQATVGSRGASGLMRRTTGSIMDAFTGGAQSREQRQLSESIGGLADMTTTLIKRYRELPDGTQKKRLRQQIISNQETMKQSVEARESLERQSFQRPGEIAEAGINTALLPLLGSGRLVQRAIIQGVVKTAPKVVAPAAFKAALRTTSVARGAIPRAIEQAAIGVGYKGAANIGEGRPVTEGVGTVAAVSAAIPFVGTGISRVKGEVGVVAAKASGTLINSLIKPLKHMVSYGKDPGRGVSAEGITANSLESLGEKVQTRLGEHVKQLKAVLTSSKNRERFFDMRHILAPLITARDRLARTPLVNEALLKRLEATITDLSNALPSYSQRVTPWEATEYERLIGEVTRYTGDLSDDKLINQGLQQVYRLVKNRINAAVPEAEALNERIADLISAKIAIKYRDQILKRQNIFNLGTKVVGIGGAVVATIASGGGAIPAILVGVGATALEKALETTLVKSRVAAWLARASSSEKDALYTKVPYLKNAIERVFGYKERSPSKERDAIKKHLIK